MFTILHSSFEWVFAGLIVFIGLMVFIINLMKGKIGTCVLSGAIWFFVFSMHKGSTAGIMTATFAALLFDAVGMPILRAFGGKK